MTKSLACEAIVSEEVRVSAGLPAGALAQQHVEIRGRAEPMVVHIVPHARTLAALIKEVDVAAA
jgi:adenylate cyclase